ncbi:MAG: autotransporter domain-containing protein [Pseudomonadales bacterium]|nr:autotransporter domain-containing protein [Pseudomonadales bacterium]
MNLRIGAKLMIAVTSLMLASAVLAQRDDPVERVIVFGDSLSDGGFFPFITGDPVNFGSFTTNPDDVAPEIFATNLGLVLLPAYGETGFNHAVGGARITEVNGPSIPITTQIDNFINAGGSLSSQDLVYIQGGGNDFFAFEDGGSTDLTILTTAATELADQVARLQAAGASQIVTLAVQAVGDPNVALFNSTYQDALVANNVNLLFFNTDALFNEIIANAGSFGITTLFAPACTVPSSLNCTRDTLATPDANETFLLADSVHPAGITQRIQGQAIASVLKAPEQIGQLSYSAQSLMNNHQSMYRHALLSPSRQDVGSIVMSGQIGAHDFNNSASTQRIGVDEQGNATNIGLDYRVNEMINAGISFAYTQGDGDFDNSQGEYDFDAISWATYVTGQKDAWRVNASLQYGQIDYDDIDRAVVLGPNLRVHSGDTEADFFAVSAGIAYTLFENDHIAFEPDLSLSYETIDVDGYAEGSSLSTDVVFGSQDVQSMIGSLGFLIRNSSQGKVNYYFRVGYETELKDDDRELTITPFGAPVSYTTEIFEADDSFYSYEGGISIQAFDKVRLSLGLSGFSGREDLDGYSVFAGATVAL